jgi:hypothetical protein
MDIPLVIKVNTKKNRRGKKSDTSTSESPKSMSSSPKTFPIPRSYATVSAPVQQTPDVDYPPLQPRYVAPPRPTYELFPKPTFQQQPLREMQYNVPHKFHQPVYNYLTPQYAVPQYAAPQQPMYPVYAQPTQLTYNPYPVYVQQPVQPQVQRQSQHYQPPHMRQPVKQMTAGTIRLLNDYEKFWTPMCKDPNIRDRVRESFNYFPN